MATKKVQIDILARDKTRKALKSVQGGLNNIRSSVFNLRNAIIGIGAGATIKSFVDVGRQVENLSLRFKFLFGSVAEGSKAFDTLVDFAAQVPFSLEEIQSASGNLAVISKDAEDLGENLKIVGNVAAITGLDFRTTAEQIQRSFAGGIASADIFRERGVRALLGFEAGATVSVERTKEAFFRIFGDGGEFGNATDELAKTFDGTLSMIQDSIFKFRKEVADAGLFDFVKFTAKTVDDAIKSNFGSIEIFAQRTSNTLIDAFEKIALGFVSLGSIFNTPLQIIFTGVKNVLQFAGSIPEPFRSGGILGFLALGFKGRLMIILIAGFFDKIQNLVSDIAEFVGQTIKKIDLDFSESMKDLSKEAQELFKIFQTDLSNMMDFTEIQGNFEFFEDGKGVQIIKDFFKLFREELEQTNKEAESLEGAFAVGLGGGADVIIKTKEELTDFQKSVQAFNKGFTETFKTAIDTTTAFEFAGKKAFRSFDTELRNALKNGKFRFKEFRESIILDLSAIIVKQQLVIAGQRALGLLKKSSIGSNIITGIGKILGFADGGIARANKPAIVGERGAELIVPRQDMQVIPNNKLMGGSSVNVTFNINTVDARGFNELLTNSRATIVNMINGAVNETGKQAII